jgi:alpha-D-ribose 1-methylphosphonate 5-triphosphate synthase subunit PhnG
MDRSARFEILTCAPRERVVAMAESLSAGLLGDIQVITWPTVGMIMARAQDGAKNEVFNLGEVLVTEARVSIDGHEGWGMVMGSSPDHALAIAIIDAALEAGQASRISVERELLDIAAAAEAAVEAELATIAATRVMFDNF